MSASSPSIALFDPVVHGHHAEHVAHLVNFWVRSRMPGRLDVVVPETMLSRHDALRELRTGPPDGVCWIPVPEISGTTPFLRSRREHVRLLRRYVDEHRPHRVHLMYFDAFLFGLAGGLRFRHDVRFSGTYFRPTFHYGAWETHEPPVLERVLRKSKFLLLRAALRNPHLHGLLSLDTLAPDFLMPARAGQHVEPLPDPVERHTSPVSADTVRDRLGVSDQRLLLLLFGAVDARKGVFPLLDALSLLDEATTERLTLAIVGRLSDDVRAPVQQRIESLQASSRLQVVLRDEYVEYDVIQPLFEAADLVLAPYQRHVGSSGIVVRAAAAGRPVLSQDYGFQGEIVRRRRLGIVVDTTRPDAIARVLRMYTSTGLGSSFDENEARRFAEENTVDAFGDRIFTALLRP